MSSHAIGIGFVLVGVLCESFSQVALKHGVQSRRLWSRAAGILCFATGVCLFTISLHYLDLSIANPLGSLSFVGVAILARMILAERITARRWAGIGLIVAGTVLVALA